MKTKIILILLILTLSLLVWRLFVGNFSQKPIEIIIKKPAKNPEKITRNENFSNDSIENNSSEIKNNSDSKNSETIEIEEKTWEVANNNVTNKKDEQKTTDTSFIINKKVLWGYNPSNNRTIDTLVIHSSYDALGSEPYDINGLIKEYQQYSVAPHFLIDRKGNVYKLVDEKNIAYHAGISKMPDGRTEANNFSIGVELMNTEEDNYTSAQYLSLNKLINYLENNHSIRYVLGHQDISPDRKTDPWNFDWEKIESEKSIHN